MSIKASTRLTSKGQFTLPAEIRRALDLRPGDELQFELTSDNKLAVEARRRRGIRELRELLPPLSLGRDLAQRDIDQAVSDAMEEQEARARSPR